MQYVDLCTKPATQPSLDSVKRLLTALGEWGVAEEKGVPMPALSLLAENAMDAYLDVAAA
ncbi:MAG: hypothetical protein O2788_00815 [Chloroflexi bacterium]|nr:hypothetical protein [Chloroflexota bacterium]